MDRFQQENRPTPQEQKDAANRLHLNFGFGERNFAADTGRAFPTTPSTFPQPLPNPQTGQQDVWGAGTPVGFSQSNYFMNNAQQPPLYQQNFQSNLQNPQAMYRGNQQPGYNNDVTNGLVHQFQHQNLGGTPRSNSPFSRPPVQYQRPRTAGNPGTQHYGDYLNAPMPGQNGSLALQDDQLPPKDASRYSKNVLTQATASCEQVSAFFQQSVQRARERNQRTKDMRELMASDNVSDMRKQQKQKAMMRDENKFLRFLRTKEKVSNFKVIKIIGKGAFGEVKLVNRISDSKIYALKSLVKSEMFKRDQLAHVRSERDILSESDSPWIVKLHTTFQDSTFLYMLMEFLPGGDLMTMLIKYEIFTEDITRFYMAELTLAIAAVHNAGFIHRDIKPDNILLDRGGHIKLTDFGLSTGFHKEHDQAYYQQLLAGKHNTSSKKDNRQSLTLDQIQLTVSNRNQINTWRKSRRQLAYSTVGTPDYIAPEIFTGKGYDYGCDWWSVGTIMYECLVGWPPFCAEESNETYKKIVEWPKYLHFPPEANLGTEAEKFVRNLICNPEDRLGRIGGARDLQAHPFFRGVTWDSLRKIRAPFEPKLSSNIDTQYFPIDEIPQQDNSAAIRAREREAGNEDSAEMSLPFIGYTYKRFDAFRGS